MKFQPFKFHPSITAGIKALGYTTPTPIQDQAIPPVLEGRDVMGLAQTGTGKTAAFVLPILQRLLQGPRGRVRALIVAPTRELAEQIHVAIATLGRDTKLRSVTIYGGVGVNPQIQKLRAGVEIVSSVQGQDAAAVAFDTIQKAVQKRIDVVMIDTAGRLHTRKDLMDEAVKIKRVCAKVKPGAPDDVWLVLDATVGQNGLRQAAAFNEQLGLTGLVVTKLDGTAKGGVLIPIVMELGVPVRFTGTGEGLDDIEPFDPQAYAKALFED